MSSEDKMIATHEGMLRLGDLEIPCYVTNKEQRLLASRRLQSVLKITDETTSSGKQVPGKRMDRFLGQKTLKPIFDKINDRTLLEPIKVTSKGKIIVGYDAKLLSEICRAMLEGRREGLFTGARQLIIAQQCEILQSAFAQVGIIALVDEATGYQKYREKDALVKILERYILDEYKTWTKMFPNEFYEEMFKLKSWKNPESVKRPGVIGRYTNDIVYERLAPGVLEELQKKNPISDKGYRKVRHHQWLTGDVGDPKLREHLWAVIALMRAATTWDQFNRMLERSFPKFGHTIPLKFEEELEDE